MGEGIGILVNGRETGSQVEMPSCVKCERKMFFAGYRRWEVHGLEGD
jgi:hypothetical protein